MRLRSVTTVLCCAALSACGCSKYPSAYSCDYVENKADYEVWYWRNVEDDNEDDNKLIGHATGLQQCEDNARAYAEAIGDEFTERSYVCSLMDDGKRMENHRNMIGQPG